jgi:hypothetical protein
MQLVTLNKETDLRAVVSRLYPGLTAARRRSVEAALLKANPSLSTSEGFQSGALVSVPDLPDLKLKTAAGKNPTADMVETLKAAVASYQELLSANLDAARADIERQRELLRRSDVAGAIRSDPSARPLATGLARNLDTRRKALVDEKTSLDKVFTRIVKDLDGLV